MTAMNLSGVDTSETGDGCRERASGVGVLEDFEGAIQELVRYGGRSTASSKTSCMRLYCVTSLVSIEGEAFRTVFFSWFCHLRHL